MSQPYPSEALTEVSELLLEYGLDPEQIANLAKDIPGECESLILHRAEVAYERQQERLADAFRAGEESGYREAMKEAGRGHLLR